MNETIMLDEAKSTIKTVMMDYLFEPLDRHTLNCIESELAEALSDIIDMDIDFNVTSEFVDKEAEVTVFIPGVGIYGNTKLTARYTSCPAVSDEEKPKDQTENAAIAAFDIAMEVVDG